MTIGIYKITNKETGQLYIGQSINIKKRFQDHIRGDGCPNSKIDCAIKKYKQDNFEFEIIEEFNKDTPFLNDVLNDSEQYYIAAYNTFNDDFHYNLTPGGDFNPMKVPKIAKKMSEKGNAFYGKCHSKTAKKKMSQAKKGKSLSEEHKQKISQALTGKHRSEETKQKISKSHRGKKLTDEHIQKIIQSKKGFKHSDKTKEKMSISHIKNYARIVKDGFSNGKQNYCIILKGERIKGSIFIDKLKKWFAENHPNEQLIIEFKK